VTLPPLAELKKRYVDRARPMPVEIEEALRADPRNGAKRILEAVEKRRYENRAEGQRLRKMLRFENELWEQGLTLVAGVDEAGMSPLAGPVVAGAAILKPGWKCIGVDDSKKVDPETREELAIVIKKEAIAWAVAAVDHHEIDRINIYHAGILALRRAVMALPIVPQHLLIDARKLKDVPIPQRGIIKGDTLSLSIAAASILAKTSRDALMTEMDSVYPGYGFAKHKGYPVPEHYQALERIGACPIHRRSFPSVRRALGLEPVQTSLFDESAVGDVPAALAEDLPPELEAEAS
jgi:ribonuclease HII